MTHLPPHIGRYEIIGLLGTGGMAEVFLGRVKGTASDAQRPVVVKRILPHLARQQQFVDMFRDEGRIAARINHRNVVRVQELGESGTELFMVMEYLAGESAAAIARQLAHRKKLLSFGLCTHLMAEVCSGLHAAHELVDHKGEPLHIVHRDVSPANIFVTYDGEVKILDFGIAVAANRLSKTDAGQVKGKFAYMSPEQCRGKTLDRRSDIFSLGIVLYELSTCRRLFKRMSDMETLEAVCNEEVVPPSQLVTKYPAELERICLKALQKDPEDRYQTAEDMQGDLLDLARTLNRDKLVELSLAKVMRKLFAERITQKKQMLSYVQAGENIPSGSMPAEEHSNDLPVIPSAPTRAPEVNLGSLPLAEPLAFIGNTQELAAQPLGRALTPPAFNLADDVPSASVTPARPRRAWLYATLLLVPLAVGVGAGFWWAELSASVWPVAAPADQITVELDTIPSQAQVFRDATLLGKTPLVLQLPASTEPVQLTIRKAGFVELTDTVVPTTDQKLRLSLQRPDEAKPPSAARPRNRGR